MSKKLNDKDKVEIIKLYKSEKITTEQIAKRFGVSARTIQRVAKQFGVVRSIKESNKVMAKYKKYKYEKRPRTQRKGVSLKTRYKLLIEHPYCSVCGARVEDGAKLEIDHIDNNCANGDINNLQVLCSWCNKGKYQNTRPDIFKD